MECGRQFVGKTAGLSPGNQALIEKLLLERLSWRGICRVLGIALTSLLRFMEELYEQSPADLNVVLPHVAAHVELLCLRATSDLFH